MSNRIAAVVLLPALLAAGAPELAAAEAAAAIRLPESDAVPGWEREGRLRRFSAADLYGHIDGGAELFLELGFEELLVQPYRKGDHDITLEVYRMESPLAALAIYLFKCGEETPWPEIETRNSSDRFQAALVRGDCFVLVNSFSGEKTLRPAMAGLAGKLLVSIPPADPADPFAGLSTAGRIAGSERLVRGPYSLQALYTLGPGDALRLGGEVFGAAADYGPADGGKPETRILVDYPDAKRAAAVFAGLPEALDPTIELVEQTGERLVFRDYAGRFGLALLTDKVIEVRVNLSSRPGFSADPDPTR